jgi:hypothetical protein
MGFSIQFGAILNNQSVLQTFHQDNNRKGEN